MLETPICNLSISKAPSSKIGTVDFENLVFGSVFTDHMLICDYSNGNWHQPQIKPYGAIEMEPSARVFHYGQAIFEGMKAYRDDHGKIWLFRPDENFRRLNRSAERMNMPQIPEDIFMDGLKELIRLDEAWVKPGEGNSLYIRPFMIATQGSVMASPSNSYRFFIILSPARSYYAGEVRVRIEQHFSRAANGGTGYAKAAGNYAAQFYPSDIAKKEGYQQVIWTDAEQHKYIEEAGTMNIFVRIDDTLITAPISERILDGITRKSLIVLAEEHGIKVEVRRISVEEVLKAAKQGSLKEVFGAGTAAVVSPVIGIGLGEEKFELPKLNDSYGSLLKRHLLDIQYNRAKDTHGWRVSL